MATKTKEEIIAAAAQAVAAADPKSKDERLTETMMELLGESDVLDEANSIVDSLQYAESCESPRDVACNVRDALAEAKALVLKLEDLLSAFHTAAMEIE